ncbi:MAG: hypothetical protein GX628_00755 [Clostridiales bacterium]|nr:hypothetical protein [Clostridiales bacterium]
MTRKLNAIILACLLCLLLVSAISCGTGGSDNTGAEINQHSLSAEDTVTDTETTELRENLPEADYEGYDFCILVGMVGTKIFNNEHFWIESENGETLNDALYQRNRTIEERFNIKISENSEKNGGNAKKDFTNAVLADALFFDTANLQNGVIPDIKYLADYHDLSYIDLDMPWWDTNVDAEQSVAGHLYYAYGWIHVTHIDPCAVMFFNKKLSADYKCPDWYQLVRDGGYTMEAVQHGGKSVLSDLDGDGVYTDADLYPYVSLGQNSYNTWMIGGGASFTGKDSDDMPILTMDSERFATVFDRVYDILSDTTFKYDPRFMPNNGGDGDAAVFRLLINDQTLFMSHGLGSVNQYRDMESDYGVLPFPKYDEAQDRYYSAMRSEKRMLVPLTTPDTDRTGIILEAMAAEGYRIVKPSYYETMLQNKYLRDDESVEMLNVYIIPNFSSLDRFGITSITNTFHGSCSKGGMELASFIVANQASFQALLDALVVG